jgi:lipopolysaccharide export system permease protein
VSLIYTYIYREIILLTLTIIGVLTFLLVAVNLFKVINFIMYTDLPIWITGKFVVLVIPLTLTLTIPAGLLAAVLIVFGRMSSDRELLALKSSGIGLAPIVAPVIVLAIALCFIDYWLVAYVVPECQKASSNMKREIVGNNPLALFSPEVVVDKIPGWRIYFDHKDGTTLEQVRMWRLDDTSHMRSSIRADSARIDLDLEHQQLVMTLFNGRQTEYDYAPASDEMKAHPGVRGDQLKETVSLNSFYEKVQKKLSWMTVPEIETIIFSMQTAPSAEQVTPYLTELQARISFALASFTFIVVGIPLAIQTQRRETMWGVIFALGIVFLYYFLGQLGRGMKGFAALYPELIIWTPNIVFQAVGFWLFSRANRK